MNGQITSTKFNLVDKYAVEWLNAATRIFNKTMIILNGCLTRQFFVSAQQEVLSPRIRAAKMPSQVPTLRLELMGYHILTVVAYVYHLNGNNTRTQCTCNRADMM